MKFRGHNTQFYSNCDNPARLERYFQQADHSRMRPSGDDPCPKSEIDFSGGLAHREISNYCRLSADRFSDIASGMERLLAFDFDRLTIQPAF